MNPGTPAADAGRSKDTGSLVDRAEATPRSALLPAEQDEVYALLAAHFDGVTPEQFALDLGGKDWILRIRRGDRLVGFSTLQVYATTFEERRLNVMYSGDTIMAPEAWGSPVLARAWTAMVRSIQRPRATEPWYWLLLSSGFRTYRFLPVFLQEFWPRHDAPTPDDAARLLTHLARERFGAEFDERAGVVRFARPQRLRESLAAVPGGKRDDPHVGFFLARNPGHAAGDELVCLASLGDENVTAAGARMLRGVGR